MYDLYDIYWCCLYNRTSSNLTDDTASSQDEVTPPSSVGHCPNDISSNDQAIPPAAATNSPILPSDYIKSTTCNMLLKKRRIRADEVDELLVKSLNSLQEKKAKTVTIDEEGHFGQQVTASLRQYTPRQRAIAKLRIQQVLT